MSRLKDKAQGIGDDIPLSTPTTKTASAPKTAPGQLMAFREQVQPLHAQIEELERKLKDTPGKLLLIADLVVVEGRKRILSPTERAELKENIRQHGVMTPITVRLREDGKYEIVSGHNRAEISLELGLTHIIAWVQSDLPEDRAKRAAFYANLLHPSLPDFEKYRGFKAQHLDTGNSYAALADEAGIARSVVSRLMSFDKLPDEAKAILAARPEVIGASAAEELAALMEKGKGPEIIKAIEALANGEITQAAAVRAAAAEPVVAKPKAEPLKIKAGRSNFAEVASKDKTLRISFQSVEHREELEANIIALIKEHAEKYKK